MSSDKRTVFSTFWKWLRMRIYLVIACGVRGAATGTGCLAINYLLK